MRTVQIGPFGGLSTKVDPKYIDPSQAQDMLNVRIEDGTIKPRYGWAQLEAAQSGHSANYGLVHLTGYNSSYAQVEEYISWETLSGNTRAYYRSTTTGAATQISATARNASPWTGFSFNGYGYLINPNEATPVFRREIGSASSFVALAVPSAPTTALGLEILYQANSGSEYAQLSWAGTDAADVTVAGAATTTNLAVSSGGELTIQHSASSNIASSFEVDLSAITAGTQDWQYNDLFLFTLSVPNTSFTIDPGTIAVQFTNADGSPVSFVPSTIFAFRSFGPAVPENSNTYVVWCHFDNKVRALWDNIKKFKVSYKVATSSGTATNNKLTISKPYIGCCLMGFPQERVPGQLAYFGYSYYYSSPDLESGLGGFNGIGNSALNGYNPLGHLGFLPVVAGGGLGCWLKCTFATSGDANVDNNRLYFADGSTYRRIVTQSDATPTYTIKMSATEILNLSATYAVKPFKFARCTGGFAFKSWVVWLYQNEGLSNVRHSRIGNPLLHADEGLPDLFEETEDTNRGQTFTLSDDGSDYPVCGSEAGDAAVIFGLDGVYAQIGNTPSEMTPCKKLPGSIGIANKYAFARMRADDGSVGVAYVARDGSGAYFVRVSTSFNGDEGFQVIELSEEIRGSFYSFLATGQSLSLSQFQSKVRIWADESTQSLWVGCGDRCLVFRRPAANGMRHWEQYEYNFGSAEIGYVASSFVNGVNRWVVRVLLTDGQLIDLEYNSVTAALITGASRDGGSAMPTPYWQSKTFTGMNRYIRRVGFFREDTTETPSVTIASSRQSATYTVATTKIYAKVSPLQQGWEHSFKINTAENNDAIDRFEFWEQPISKGGHR